MKLSDFFAILILLVLLAAGLYLLWTNLPGEPVEFQRYQAQIEQNLSLKSVQFYPNMRFSDAQITYSLSETCSQKKKADFHAAVELVEANTILKFAEVSADNPDIRVTCSNISPEPEQEGHFIAGEGGPSLFLNTTKYAIIVRGEVALYRSDTCDTPQIATHELLHALGFDHNKNQNSIMYPITKCNQKIDKYIVDEINRIYSEPSLPDLEIESVEANKTSRYLNFDVTIANIGLREMKNSTLQVWTNGKLIKEFEVGEIDIGAKRHLSVTYMRLPSNSGSITFVIKDSQAELNRENNKVEVLPA